MREFQGDTPLFISLKRDLMAISPSPLAGTDRLYHQVRSTEASTVVVRCIEWTGAEKFVTRRF